MSRLKQHLGGLTEADAELLAQAYQQVIPIRGHARVTHEPARKPNPNEQTLRRRANASAVNHQADNLSDGDPFTLDDPPESYRTSGVSSQALRQLKRQASGIRETMDLHGLTRDQARIALQHFVANAAARGVNRVCIIHGQGYGSRDGASVLRYLTRHWLAQMSQVLAFVTPPPAAGGKGAVLVLLRTSQAGQDRLR
ncbi:MAG TPA: Smr/MutS family protein [Orrella sp.]